MIYKAVYEGDVKTDYKKKLMASLDLKCNYYVNNDVRFQFGQIIIYKSNNELAYGLTFSSRVINEMNSLIISPLKFNKEKVKSTEDEIYLGKIDEINKNLFLYSDIKNTLKINIKQVIDGGLIDGNIIVFNTLITNRLVEIYKKFVKSEISKHIKLRSYHVC